MPPEPNPHPAVEQPAPPIRVEWGQSSDPGRDPTKQVNEDSSGYAQTPYGHLFVVCDGMGGHTGGRQASDTAIRTIFEEVTLSHGQRSAREALQHSVEVAAKRVYALGGSAENFQRPGSTCVAVLLHQGRAETAHVGDSRAYSIRGKRINRLTRDHSMVQDLVDAGSLTEREAQAHPDANKITRALGMTEEVEVELRAEPLELYADDVFVLATDGLTDLVTSEEILQLTLAGIEADSPQRACGDLVTLANERGGHDNITVQVVRVLSTGPKRSRTLAQEPSAFADDSSPGEPEAREPAPGDDTMPDDGAPTFLEPMDSDRAPTKLIEPASALSATAPDAPSPTIPEAPHVEAGDPEPVKRVPTTAPDRPQPTVVDPSLASQHADVLSRSAGPASAMPPAVGRRPLAPTTSGSKNPLVIVVVVMAVVIAGLLALLAWMMFDR